MPVAALPPGGPIAGPQGWTVEIWDSGAFTKQCTLAHPEFAAPAVDKLNTIGTFSFTLGLEDADAPHCNPKLGREVKVFRNGTFRWAGRIWTHDVDWKASKVTFGCWSLLDYTRDRFIDRGSQRIDLLGGDANFESGLGGFSATGTTPTVITSDHILGTHAAQLVQSTDDADAYISKTISYTAGGEGDLITFVAWFKIVTWTGPALGDWGMVIRQTDGAGNVFDFNPFRIDYQTPRGKWLKATCTTWVPPLTTRNLESKLYSINGTMEWDAGFMGLMESLSLLATDQATIAGYTVAFLQDATKGKSNLNINTATPLTGVIRDRTYQYADHISGLSALTEYPRLNDGMDIEVTPARVFKTYAISAGGIGADKTATVTLTIGGNCIAQGHKFDGPAGGNDITTLGVGGGPGREEGGAVDNTKFGGCTVQQVLPAPSNDVQIDTLGPWAARELTIYDDPTTMDLTVTDRELGFSLAMGDRVTLAGGLGYVAESGHGRIVGLSADPKSDLVTATVNHWS